MSYTINETGVEPITLNEAKQQCYIPVSDTDTDMEELLESFIKSARMYAENRMWRQLVDATITYKLDDFPIAYQEFKKEIIELPRAPLISVTSIQYETESGTQTISDSDYRVDTTSQPARIEPVTFWPSANDQINAVTITYKAGYGDDNSKSTVPEDIKVGIKMRVKSLYDNRDSAVLVERSGEYHQFPTGSDFIFDMHSLRTP